MIPLSRGGTNWPANLRPACDRCNRKKRNQISSEWKNNVVAFDAKPKYVKRVVGRGKSALSADARKTLADSLVSV